MKGNTSYSKIKIHFTLIDYIYTKLNGSKAIYSFFKSRENVSSSNMIWDGITYLYPNKRKTTAFSKFSVIFWEEKSTFTLTWCITTVAFFKIFLENLELCYL